MIKFAGINVTMAILPHDGTYRNNTHNKRILKSDSNVFRSISYLYLKFCLLCMELNINKNIPIIPGITFGYINKIILGHGL